MAPPPQPPGGNSGHRVFEARLKILLALWMFALAIVVARLVDMQIVHADDYRRQAEDALLKPVKSIPAVRGRILDRLGAELVTDEPCWDVKVDYGILSMDQAYLAGLVQRCRREGTFGAHLSEGEVESRLHKHIARMWVDLARFCGQPPEVLRARADDVCERIGAIRAAVTARRGFDTAVREERMRHAIVTGLDDQQQVAARQLLTPYPWVEVEDSTHRVHHVHEPFAHVLGQLGPVNAERLESDPFADDQDRRYLGNENFGVGGAEQVAESLLRGARGRFQSAMDGAIIESVPPQAGRDVHLTIRHDLQQRLYELLDRRAAELTGDAAPAQCGSIVVLDVQSRDCLALVSYPAFDPARFDELYEQLRVDLRRQPLRFRCVANQYAPGSIVKPLTCLAALNQGVIEPDTRITCEGALFPDHPDRWRCWAAAGTDQRMRHGPLAVREAIKHSCNIFMYKVGEMLGATQLCNYFDMAGFGRPTGTRLVEEVAGINPTPSWLASVKGQSITPGKARHFAMGQAEVSATPLQVANLIAVYASRESRPVTLVQEMSESVAWTLPGDLLHWQIIREGMYDVVNDEGGTARATAYLDPASGYALCGKTGSAEAMPWPVSYRIRYIDEREHEGVHIQPAATRDDAIRDFVLEHPGWAFKHDDVVVHERWPSRPPAGGGRHSHAWFAGFLQPVDAAGQPIWERPRRIAFSVMVEFGGSGGRVSAPIGKRVAEIVMETLGPDLDPDAPARPLAAETS